MPKFHKDVIDINAHEPMSDAEMYDAVEQRLKRAHAISDLISSTEDLESGRLGLAENTFARAGAAIQQYLGEALDILCEWEGDSGRRRKAS